MRSSKKIILLIVTAGILALLLVLAFENSKKNVDDKQERYLRHVEEKMTEDICSLENVLNASVEISLEEDIYAAEVNIEINHMQGLPLQEEEYIRKTLNTVFPDLSYENITITVHNEFK